MSDFEFLHAADLHLDSPLRGLDADAPAARIRGATREALSRLVDLALERRVAFVLLAGDLYDGDSKDWRTAHFLVEQLARLKRAGIPCVSVRGNHDAESILTRNLNLPDRHLRSDRPDSVLLSDIEVAIHGQSFATRAISENLALHYPPAKADWFNIGLLHTACGSTEHDDYAPCTEAQLARHGYDYWALGHVHVRSDSVHPHCRIVFPGNLQGRHIRETGPKGATLVRVAGRRILSAEHVVLDVMRWALLPVDVSGAADIDTVLTRARLLLDAALIQARDGYEDRLLAVRVVLEGACAAHRQLATKPDAVRAQFRGLAAELADSAQLWIEDVKIRTSQPLDSAALADQPGAVGALVDALETLAPVEPATQDFLQLMAKHLDLLEEDHPARAIMRDAALPEGLAAQARALLLAELVRD